MVDILLFLAAVTVCWTAFFLVLRDQREVERRHRREELVEDIARLESECGLDDRDGLQ